MTDCNSTFLDLGYHEQERLYTPRFTERRARRDENTVVESRGFGGRGSPRWCTGGSIRSLSTAASTRNDTPFTWDAGGDPLSDFECAHSKLSSKQLTILYKVISSFMQKVAETAETANESHHHVTSLADQLARETALREASDVARSLEIKTITEQLACNQNRGLGEAGAPQLDCLQEMSKVQQQTWRADIDELWRRLLAETRARQDVVRDLEDLKGTTCVVAAALEKVIAKNAESSANGEWHLLAESRECCAFREKMEHSSPHVEVSNILGATHEELRAEVCEKVSCELSTLVGTAEANLRSFITDMSSSCEGEVSRLFQACDHAATHLQEEAEAWQVAERQTSSRADGILHKFETFETALKQGLQVRNGFEEHSADDHAALQAKCGSLFDSMRFGSDVVHHCKEAEMPIAKVVNADLIKGPFDTVAAERKIDSSHTGMSDWEEQHERTLTACREMVEIVKHQQGKLSERFEEALMRDVEPRVRALESDLGKIRQHLSFLYTPNPDPFANWLS